MVDKLKRGFLKRVRFWVIGCYIFQDLSFKVGLKWIIFQFFFIDFIYIFLNYIDFQVFWDIKKRYLLILCFGLVYKEKNIW